MANPGYTLKYTLAKRNFGNLINFWTSFGSCWTFFGQCWNSSNCNIDHSLSFLKADYYKKNKMITVNSLIEDCLVFNFSTFGAVFYTVVLKLFSGSIILLQINIQSIKKINFGISKFSCNLYPIWPFCSFCFGRHCTTVQRTVV